MMQLKELIYGVSILEILGDTAVDIQSIAFDSRAVEKQSCFFAQKGTKVDGHRFIEEVVDAGAIAVVCESFPDKIKKDCTYIKVKSSSKALGICAANFYDNPSRHLKLVGVTGTNGKTTTVSLLHQLFQAMKVKTGLISTVVNKIGEEEVPSSHTTPDAIQLNQLLNKMRLQGCEYCFMEVSSHAVAQNRIAGLHFRGGVFTNITHEHLDFHKTFVDYLNAKRTFFNQLSKRSEEHTSELQSRPHLVCRLLLEKKKKKKY